MRTRVSNRRRLDRGAAAVEMAILLPLLVLMVFGLLDFALVLNANLSITNAAHEGARASALGENASQVQARVASTSDPLSAQFMTMVGTPTITNVQCATKPGTTSVTVTYRIQLVVPMPGISSVDVSGKGVQQCYG